MQLLLAADLWIKGKQPAAEADQSLKKITQMAWIRPGT